MSDDDPLKQAFRAPALSRRDIRAMRTRAQALSPVRILIQVLLLPVVTLAVTISIYTRTSPYERVDALRHLAAMAGCDTAQAMDLAPAFKGQIGYHARNDPDGDGIACGSVVVAAAQPVMPAFAIPSATRADVEPRASGTPATNTITGAKFIKP